MSVSFYQAMHIRVEWTRMYQDMSPVEKVNPFRHFMKFMDVKL